MPTRHDEATGMSAEVMAGYNSYDASSLPPDLLDLVHHTEAELRRLYKAARPRRESRHTHRPVNLPYTEGTIHYGTHDPPSHLARHRRRGVVRAVLSDSDDRSTLQEDVRNDARRHSPQSTTPRQAMGASSINAQGGAAQWERQQQSSVTLSSSPSAARRALNLTASSLVQERRRRLRQGMGGPTMHTGPVPPTGTLHAGEHTCADATRRVGPRPWARALRDLLPFSPSRSIGRLTRDAKKRARAAMRRNDVGLPLNPTVRRDDKDSEGQDRSAGQDEERNSTSVVGDSEDDTQDDKEVDEEAARQHETSATPRRLDDEGGYARATMTHKTATTPTNTVLPTVTVDTTSVSGTIDPLPASRLVRHDLVEQLRRELAAQAATLRAMRVRHATEVAALREANAQTRADAARETREQLTESYAVTQGVLQAAIETERQRAQELEERVRALRQEQRILQKRHDTVTAAMATQEEMLQRKEDELQALHARVSELQNDMAAQTEARLRHAVEAKLSREQVVAVQDKEASLAAHVRELQDRLAEQERSAKETLRQLEAEFTRTSNSYQELLSEATNKVSRLEGVQRRYRQLRDVHAALTAEKERLVTSGEEERRRQSEVVTTLRTELDTMRERLTQSEAKLQEETSNARTVREEVMRQLEQQKASAQSQEMLWTQRLETANHTIQVLRTQLAGTQQEATEEQAHAETLAMQTAEREMRLQKELSEERRAAAAYKVRAEDTIASLKRQLREKDTKLQALIATSAEPLQRLRAQLAEERTRRGAAEEQLKIYKSKAKEAEERALREMRREQLRGGLLEIRPAGRDSLAPYARAAQERRPSSVSSATITDGAGKQDARRHPMSAQTGVSWSARTRTRSTVPPLVATNSTVPAGSEALAANRSGAGLIASGTSHYATVDDHSPPRVQITAITDLNTRTASPRYATTSPGQVRDVGAARNTALDAHKAATPPARQDGGDRAARSEPALEGDPARATASAEKENIECEIKKVDDVRRPRPLAFTASVTTASDKPQSPGCLEGGLNASLDTISVTPIPTAGSLSAISLSSAAAASSSGSRRRRVAAAVDGRSSRQGRTQSSETPSVGTRHLAEDTAPPLPTPTNAVVVDVDDDAESGAANVRQWRGVYQRCGSDANEAEVHEQRMRDFHASAADVLRKITGRREEFLAQCANIIQHSVANALPSAVTTEEVDMVDGESNAAMSSKS